MDHLGTAFGLQIQSLLRPLDRLIRRGPVLGAAAEPHAGAATDLAGALAEAMTADLSAGEREVPEATLRSFKLWLEGHAPGAPGTLAAHGGRWRKRLRGWLRDLSQDGSFFDLQAASKEDRALIAAHLPEGPGARVAIFGHTHAAREIRLEEHRTYRNTGTWMDLMELPPVNRDDEVAAFVDALESGRVPRSRRLTYAEVTPDGASLRAWAHPDEHQREELTQGRKGARTQKERREQSLSSLVI